MQTIDVIQRLNKSEKRYLITGLSAFSSEEVFKQIEENSPLAFALLKGSEKVFFPCKRFNNSIDMLEELRPDISVIASSGGETLNTTLKAIEVSKKICLANKESLVMGGKIVLEKLTHSNCTLIPVDSEHSGVFQLLKGEKAEHVRKIFLTASGGALRSIPPEMQMNSSIEEVLKHPTWKMGKKITVDSATLFNKGLELIEAKHLFGIDKKKIGVYFCPTSYVHSMVKMIDGTIKIHSGVPDMRIPIAYSLTYPERENVFIEEENSGVEIETDKIILKYADPENFPALKMAFEIYDEPSSFHIVYNSANEAAVDLFLKKKIAFGEIFNIVRKELNSETGFEPSDAEEIIFYSNEVKKRVTGKKLN